jgi:hypothetical protein
MFAGGDETPAYQVEPGTLSISISHGERGALLSSARGLASVKLDAIEHAQRAGQEGDSTTELDHHLLELDEVQDLVEQLDRPARDRTEKLVLSGRHALVDEIVHGALIAESQELADAVVELEPDGELRDITARVGVVRHLVTTLAGVRA